MTNQELTQIVSSMVFDEDIASLDDLLETAYDNNATEEQLKIISDGLAQLES